MKKTTLFTVMTLGLLSFMLVMAPVAPVASVTVEDKIVDTVQTKKMENLVQRADAEINRRLVALNNLVNKISLLKRVSDGQKAAFTSEIQTNISNLTDLKTKIDAEKDLTTLKSDVQSIVDNYRIFALYIPKIHLLAGADVAGEMAGSLGSLVIKLQNKITTDKDAGKDVTKLQTLLTDMQNKIADASNQAANLTDQVVQLVPSGYPGNADSLASAREMLKVARVDIQTARQDAHTIIAGLKALHTETTTSN